MQSNWHSKFILSPIQNILQDSVRACRGIGMGIETQSLGEYVLQTTFLKMTGASEQKLKCICWEVATDDFAYRRDFLRNNHGECSSYKDKNEIYGGLVEQLSKMDESFSEKNLFKDIDISKREAELLSQKIDSTIKQQEKKQKKVFTKEEKEAISIKVAAAFNKTEEEQGLLCRRVFFEGIRDRVDAIVGRSLVASWEQHNYLNYLTLWGKFATFSYAWEKTLLSSELKKFYEDYVYNHRNMCAHNLSSLQNNLPTLKKLSRPGFLYDNYYFRFSILILLDEVFMRLYSAYLDAKCVNRF